MPFTLLFGIALGGLATGYMTAGSASPVVGIVGPAILSTFAGALALLFKPSTDKKISEILKSADPIDRVVAELQIQDRARNDVAARIGQMLVAFFLAFFIGSILGTVARTHSWFAKGYTPPTALVQAVEHAPTLEKANEWIASYRTLQELGFDDLVISHVFTLPLDASSTEAPASRNLVASALQSKSLIEALNKIQIYHSLHHEGFDEASISRILTLPVSLSTNANDEFKTINMNPWMQPKPIRLETPIVNGDSNILNLIISPSPFAIISHLPGSFFDWTNRDDAHLTFQLGVEKTNEYTLPEPPAT